LLVRRRVDHIERPAMRREHVGEGFGEVLYQMKPVRHLCGGRRSVACALSLGGPIREQRYGLAALQIHEDCAISVPFPEREIIHPQHSRGRGRRDGQLAPQTQQGLPAHGEAPALAEAPPDRAA
jgi:hypothetical protein